MISFRSAPRSALLAMVATVTLGLASCGSDSSSGGSGGAELGSAKVVLGGKVITWASAYVAVCEGFFTDHGLDVEVTVSPQGTTSAIAGVVSGDALAAMTGSPAAVSPVREGAPVQVLFNASRGYGVQVVASNELVERKGLSRDMPLEERVKALQGETLSILNPGDSIDQLYRYAMKLYGMEPDRDVTITALNEYSNMFSAMKVGSVDVLAGSPPNGSQAEAEGLGMILFDGSEFPNLEDYPYLVGAVNSRELADNPERVRALVQGIADAAKFIRDDPEAAKPCLRKEFADLDDKTFESAYEFAVTSIPESPLITEEIYQALSDFADASGQPLGVSYEEAVAADFVRDTLGSS